MLIILRFFSTYMKIGILLHLMLLVYYVPLTLVSKKPKTNSQLTLDNARMQVKKLWSKMITCESGDDKVILYKISNNYINSITILAWVWQFNKEKLEAKKFESNHYRLENSLKNWVKNKWSMLMWLIICWQIQTDSWRMKNGVRENSRLGILYFWCRPVFW